MQDGLEDILEDSGGNDSKIVLRKATELKQVKKIYQDHYRKEK